MIACETVIKEMLPFLSTSLDYRTLESGLHRRPDTLRQAIQEEIDRMTHEADEIVLAFGLCSKAVVGLKAAGSTLVVPRVDDCIGMFLGSRENYRNQLLREPGTFFLSKGWIDAGITPLDEYAEWIARFGKERAVKLRKAVLKHYTRLAFIDMGHGDREESRAFAQKAAQDLGLRYDEIEGNAVFLRKMAERRYDCSFLAAPPGKAIQYEDFDLV